MKLVRLMAGAPATHRASCALRWRHPPGLHLRQQDDELVSSLSANGVRGARALHQALAMDCSSLSPVGGPGIVDVLENRPDQGTARDLLSVARKRDRLTDPIVESARLGKPVKASCWAEG